MLVSGLRGHHVIDVACGSGDAHSLAVADDGRCIAQVRTALIVTGDHSHLTVIAMGEQLCAYDISFWKFMSEIFAENDLVKVSLRPLPAHIHDIYFITRKSFETFFYNYCNIYCRKNLRNYYAASSAFIINLLIHYNIV